VSEVSILSLFPPFFECILDVCPFLICILCDIYKASVDLIVYHPLPWYHYSCLYRTIAIIRGKAYTKKWKQYHIFGTILKYIVCLRYRYCLCFIPSQSCVSEVSILSLFYTKSVMCVRGIDIVCFIPSQSCVSEVSILSLFNTKSVMCVRGIDIVSGDNIDTSDTHDWLGIKQRQYRYLWHTWLTWYKTETISIHLTHMTDLV
jgi:hypothetical protein